MWKKILGGFLLIVVVAIGLIFWLTSGMGETADAFFAALKKHDYPTAERYLSADFKANTSESALRAFVKHNRLDRVKETHWESRSMESGRGTLKGSVILDNGDAIPLVMKFVKNGDNWQIYAIEKAAAGLQTLQESSPLPSPEDQTRLAKRTVALFANAMESRNMRKLWEGLGTPMQRQFTPADLQKAFQSVMNAQVDWEGLKRLDPLFDHPARLDQGILKMSFYYPTRPAPLEFHLEFIKEGGEWKPVSIELGPKRESSQSQSDAKGS
jgi:hypothetical protein